MLGYDAWCIPSAAYLAVGRALLAAKFAELRLRELLRTPSMRTSENPQNANFAVPEFSEVAVSSQNLIQYAQHFAGERGKRST